MLRVNLQGVFGKRQVALEEQSIGECVGWRLQEEVAANDIGEEDDPLWNFFFIPGHWEATEGPQARECMWKDELHGVL